MAQEAQASQGSSLAGAADGDGASTDYARRWLILSVVCLGQLMVVLDATVVLLPGRTLRYSPVVTGVAFILPSLVVIGLGLGLVFGCGLNTATYGAAAADAGVGSALVNTCQQVGGSIGTALLNTIAASALSSYLVTHGHSQAALAGADVHSYIVAFWVSAAIFAGSAVVCAVVLRPGILIQDDTGSAAPVVA